MVQLRRSGRRMQAATKEAKRAALMSVFPFLPATCFQAEFKRVCSRCLRGGEEAGNRDERQAPGEAS